MTHIHGQRDADLHDEYGHVGTARTANGRDLEQHERRIKAHLAMHEAQGDNNRTTVEVEWPPEHGPNEYGNSESHLS